MWQNEIVLMHVPEQISAHGMSNQRANVLQESISQNYFELLV